MLKKRAIVFIGIFFMVISLQARRGMPDFMILGVTKCGTTSLYNYLIQHPRIAGANRKEIHFFDGNGKKGIEYYKKQFPRNVGDALIGEASPGYFWKNGCLEKIAHYCPTTQFIVIFRDPVKRIISEYLRRVRAGIEKQDFEDAIVAPGKRNAYLNAGCYSAHLQRWLKRFPVSQFKILILEDLIADPEHEVNKVFKFLNIEESQLTSYEQYNKSKKKLEVKSEVIEMLKAFYAPYNKQLEKFLGRTLPWQ